MTPKGKLPPAVTGKQGEPQGKEDEFHFGHIKFRLLTGHVAFEMSEA